MIIVQLSDTHITKPDKKVCNIAPTAENLSRCIAHINQLNPPVDVVLVTGDLTHTGSYQEALHIESLLADLKYPFFIVPGNHDTRRTLCPTFDNEACPKNTDGFIHYTVDDYEVRLIGLDSLNHGKAGGKISKQTTIWLDEHLAEEPKKPTILFMHHPPVKFGILETDIDGFLGAKRLASVVKKYNNIERILCGHIHMQTHTRWAGTVISTAPSSTGMKIDVDLSQTKPSQFRLDTPNYLLHYWTPDKNLITHTMYACEAPQYYPFEM